MTPKPGTYLVDTSVCAELLRGDEGLLERFSKAETALIGPIVEGELLHGALGSARPDANEAAVGRLAALGTRVPLDHEVSSIYARLKRELRATGRPIPDNDIWVAACAVAEDAALVTRDAHFDALDGLPREEW